MLTRRNLVQMASGLPLVPLFAGIARAQDWAAVEAEARGQTVYFNAWAGSETINAYVAWAGKEIEAKTGVKLEHVKVADAAEVVRRVRDEVKAGRQDGSVDLVWINGENFRAMKADRLLYGPFAEELPNYKYVDIEGKPTTLVDFAESVEGLESPWGMAQLTFFGDSSKIPTPPVSMQELKAFAAANPGRVTYPAPPDFHGTTFVKQVLLETIVDRDDLQLTISKEDFTRDTGPLWAFLDDLHPHLWREGKQFPQSQAQMKQMLADGELLIAISFNPNEPANMVANNELPATTIAWQHEEGTIGNTHFLAIPINARAKAGAQIVANFMLSPEAQARKADLKVWGDPTVLAISKLPPEQAKLFSNGEVPGGLVIAAPPLPEPHASWVPLLEAAWLERYGA
jgi:putative thiamine transport system substrate-binding protein